ncbi:MAG: nucleotidyl transferase AbiEii/AbiGii toxin family protein [Candidatus Firestonebacteria bacterium]
MLHNNQDKFKEIIRSVQAKTGFRDIFLEKDYYLTLLLSKINIFNNDLVFKGGTCFNKIYFPYYRLSEDLDFTMKLPSNNITRGMRSRAMKPIKENIEKYLENIGLKLDKDKEPGRNENKQYVFMINYDSIFMGTKGTIKLEVGLRFNPLLKTENRNVVHCFTNQITNESLFSGGEVNCLSLKESVAEKLRAAAGREMIAPRDFYDLDYLIRNKFNISDPEVLKLFELKTKEESTWDGMPKYCHNLGRSDKEIDDMRSRIESELYPVIKLEEREKFNIDIALARINKAFDVVKIKKTLKK